MISLPSISALGAILALVLGVAAIVAVIGVVGTFVIIVVANRGDPDATGKRPFVVYLFAVSFVTIWTALVGSSMVIAGLVQLIGTHSVTASPGVIHPVGDAAARSVVFGLLVTAVSVWVLLAHVKKGLAVVADEPAGSPSRRVAQAYVAAVGFVALLVAIGAVIAVVYSIFQILGPGTFASTDARIGPLRTMLDSIWLGLAAGVILVSHLGLVPGGLSPLGALDPRHLFSKKETPGEAPPSSAAV